MADGRDACTKDSFQAPLVKDLLARARVVKLSADEAKAIDRMLGRVSRSLEDFCRCYARDFGWDAVCVTRAEKGCVLLVGEDYVDARGYSIHVADAVGAGDAFAAAFVHGLGMGWPPADIADFSNRLAAVVASKPGAIPPWTLEEVRALR